MFVLREGVKTITFLTVAHLCGTGCIKTGFVKMSLNDSTNVT